MAGAFTPYFLRNFRIEISGFVSDVQAGGWLGGEKSLPEREALAHLSHLWLLKFLVSGFFLFVEISGQ